MSTTPDGHWAYEKADGTLACGGRGCRWKSTAREDRGGQHRKHVADVAVQQFKEELIQKLRAVDQVVWALAGSSSADIVVDLIEGREVK